MPHKFDPSKKEVLDARERRKILPPEETLRKAGIREGISFADIGCGVGYFSIPASRMVGKGKVYAIDIQRRMLEQLKKEDIGNIEVVESSEEEIPLASGSADLALMADVLHELEGEGTLREAHRILKPNGRLAVVDWKKEESGGWGPPLEERLSLAEAEERLEKAGFAVVERFEVPPYHFGIIATKGG